MEEDQKKLVEMELKGKSEGGLLHRLVTRFYGAGAGQEEPVPQETVQKEALPDQAPSPQKSPASEKRPGHTASSSAPTNSLLYALWSEWNGIQAGLDAFDYVLNLPVENGRGGQQLLGDAEGETTIAQIKLRLMSAAKQRFLERGADGTNTVNAKPYVFLSKNKMLAWLFLFPPMGGGRPAGLAELQEALHAAGICFGVEQDRLAELAGKPEYFRLCVVACGIPAVPGTDGCVEERLPREPGQMAPKLLEGDLADYRSVNYINMVREGEVICDITPPSPGADGVDILGNVVSAKAGAAPPVPQGQNTGITEDGLHLVARTSGNLVFERGVFRVRPTLVIQGDVDYRTGNLDFIGDIVIHGDVRAGFSIHATGMVTVDGVVEGAMVETEGDLIVTKGILGDDRAVIKSGKSVRAAYLENCVVYAGTTIQADCVLNAQLYSDGNIQIVNGRGTVIGGVLTAVDRVEAKIIGARSGVLTEIILGQRSFALVEASELEDSLEQLNRERRELKRTIEYLEQQEPTPEHSATLSRYRLRHATVSLKTETTVKRLKALREEQFDLSRCRLICQTLYPRAKITIGSESLSVEDVLEGCNVHTTKNGIRLT